MAGIFGFSMVLFGSLIGSGVAGPPERRASVLVDGSSQMSVPERRAHPARRSISRPRPKGDRNHGPGRLRAMPVYTYGGQALIEGVMMRGRDAIAVALRHPDGRIVTATERLDSGFHGNRAARLPLIRGLVVLYETLFVGTRWLVRSASVAASEEGSRLAAAPSRSCRPHLGSASVSSPAAVPRQCHGRQCQNGPSSTSLKGSSVGLFIGYLLLIAQAAT
jgi:hypothetical protein